MCRGFALGCSCKRYFGIVFCLEEGSLSSTSSMVGSSREYGGRNKIIICCKWGHFTWTKHIYFLIRPYSISIYNFPSNYSAEINCKNMEKRACLHASVIPIMPSVWFLKNIGYVQSIFLSWLVFTEPPIILNNVCDFPLVRQIVLEIPSEWTEPSKLWDPFSATLWWSNQSRRKLG